MSVAELEHWKTLLIALCGVFLWVVVSAAALLRYWLADHKARRPKGPAKTSGGGEP
ncbi:hypothetical protein Pth03_01010 [Planotetraspora thailandica]|uniref:Uncharacterized protein n=1 Tax=Planotetraspora thailandica TaxID=487172 RepID=A0A8J3XR78_9ACTN|nr:hypothetical protein [Planotetraspora thailandica]GII51712.1 hypothetical protein Pth03_01010 [Planotetraspora thailandica]